jgi:hypothetical protein
MILSYRFEFKNPEINDSLWCSSALKSQPISHSSHAPGIYYYCLCCFLIDIQLIIPKKTTSGYSHEGFDIRLCPGKNAGVVATTAMPQGTMLVYGGKYDALNDAIALTNAHRSTGS